MSLRNRLERLKQRIGPDVPIVQEVLILLPRKDPWPGDPDAPRPPIPPDVVLVRNGVRSTIRVFDADEAVIR
jgi:hypothetical protein